MMLCGWGVKAGMACLQVKLYVPISERFRKCNGPIGIQIKALYKCPGLLLLTCMYTGVPKHRMDDCSVVCDSAGTCQNVEGVLRPVRNISATFVITVDTDPCRS